MKISRYQLSDDKDNYYRFQIINAIVPRFNGNIFSLLVKLLRIRLHRVISSSKLFRAIVKKKFYRDMYRVDLGRANCCSGVNLLTFLEQLTRLHSSWKQIIYRWYNLLTQYFTCDFFLLFFFFSSNLRRVEQSSRIEAFLRRIFSSRVDENLYNKMQRAPISSFPFCVLKLPRFAVAQ